MVVFVEVDGLSVFRALIGVVLADVGVVDDLLKLDLFFGVDGGVLSL